MGQQVPYQSGYQQHWGPQQPQPQSQPVSPLNLLLPQPQPQVQQPVQQQVRPTQPAQPALPVATGHS